MAGWVRMDRKITEWEWYKEPYTRIVFEHLLYTANHSPGRWRGIEIAPGQTVTSVKKLAEANGITQQNVRTALKHLESTGEISKKSTRELTKELTIRATLITIEKWGLYQTGGQKLTKELTKELTLDQLYANTTLTTNKNEKKEKKEKNIFKRDKEKDTGYLQQLHNSYAGIKAMIQEG